MKLTCHELTWHACKNFVVKRYKYGYKQEQFSARNKVKPDL